MKALIAKLLGIAGIIAQYLFSKKGKLVMTWAAKAVAWVAEAEKRKDPITDEALTGSQKFNIVAQRVTVELSQAGIPFAISTVRKIIELAHGAWEDSQPPKK